MTDAIYLDHAATTPVRQEVRRAMEPYLTDLFANPSSIYGPAQAARAAVDAARDTVAECLGATAAEIIFTSGATESNNAAVKGVALARRETHRHLVTTTIEHHAVLHPVQELAERFEFDASIVSVGSSGIVHPDDIERALRPDTALISVMWANNEIGTIQPVVEIAGIARSRAIPFHVDAVQAAGYIPIDLQTVPIDLLSLSAHKFYGPKGVGVLYIRRGTPWWPLLTGGGQERNRRAGTENVAGIVGLATALSLASRERDAAGAHARCLRDLLLEGICTRIARVSINGELEARLPNNLNLSVEGVHGESLLLALDLAGVMVSSGSACTSGSLEPSHVLQAIGVPDALVRSSLRLTTGRDTTQREIERTIEILAGTVDRLRHLSPSPARP
jgi:cysteine desulfurase